MSIDKKQITAVILAGGKARRLKGQDKGLILLNAKSVIEYALDVLKNQVKTILISANRNQSAYAKYAPTISDDLSDYQGPLAGIAKAMQQAKTRYLLVMPCDCPLIEKNLIEKLISTLAKSQADISVAFDGTHLHPVFSLMKVSLLENLQKFLDKGERKASLWCEQNKMIKADLSQHPEYFSNLNTPADFASLTKDSFTPPVLGFAAFSGVGKTSLMTKVITKLTQKGLQVAVIKHAHHEFDIDKKGKDSYKHKKAGAQQVLLVSDKRSALMTEHIDNKPPDFVALLAMLDTRTIDLILVEGCKYTKVKKIELQRIELNHPALYPDDKNIIALASNDLKQPTINRVLLDLNDTEEITKFILAYAKHP